MELVDVGCTDAEDVLRRLGMFGEFWGSHRRFEGLSLLWNTAWKSTIETLAVFVYGNRMMNVFLKVEYVHKDSTCRIEIVSMSTGEGMWFSNELAGKESLAKKLLVDLFSLSRNELYSFAADHDQLHLFASQQGELHVFECPHCGAKYSERKLRHNSDGSILCQNCGLWTLPPPSGPEEQKAE